MNAIRRVGFIGVGNMGNPMAAQLIKAGFDVAAYDIRPETLARFTLEHGGRAAESLAALGRGADALITMLPDGKIVRAALLGEGGAATALAAGAVVIDMSTSDPTDTVALARALGERGIECVDAPVMGGVVFARDGTLDIMTGGADSAIERCLPLFDAMGRQVFRCGRIGAGHALKALNNCINACALANVLEALVIGRKFGLDTNTMIESMQAMCTGRNHPIDKKVLPQVLTRKYGTGMAMAFIAKDVKIAVDTAHALGAPAPLAERVAEIWREAAERLGTTLDQTQIVRFWEEAAGVSLTDPKN